jgi:hypothetical protein
MSETTKFFIAVLGAVIIMVLYGVCAPMLAKLDASTIRAIGEGIFIFVVCLFGLAILIKKFSK